MGRRSRAAAASVLLAAVLSGCGGGGGSAPQAASSGGVDVTVTWSSPAANTDGSVLNDLSGFRVRYGTGPGSLSRSSDVQNPAATSVVLSGLGSGTWYFAVSAVNSSGVESDLSNLVQRNVP